VNARRAVIGLLALAAVISCRPDDQRTETLDPLEGVRRRADLPPDVIAHLDSGSAAFRDDRFGAALEHYTRVTELEPDLGAGWFGVYMAQEALGDLEAAEAALERVQEIAPGATIVHEDGPEGGA
jgi:tetratricopeptide (TPR) repeat protein